MTVELQKTFGAVVGMDSVVPVEPDSVECADCGAKTKYPLDVDGEMLCEDCAVECADCGCAVRTDEATRADNGDYYCDSCYDENYTSCDRCGCEVSRDDSVCSDDGDSYCEECYSDRFCRCEHCNCEVRRDHAYCSENGDSYCESCYSEHYTSCSDCGCELLRDDAYYSDYDAYCESCYPGESSDDEWQCGIFRPSQSFREIRSHRKFGVELETSKCPDHHELNGNTSFACKPDGSISGMEFVSPVLSSDKGLAEIRDFCRRANGNGFEVNNACGYHAHFDVSNECAANLKSICFAYLLTYSVWSAFVPRNRRENSFCGAVHWDATRLAAIADLDDFREFVNYQDRYCWFNVAAYRRHKTFEVRLHTATLDAEKVCNWVKAHARFMDWASRKTWKEIREVFSGDDNAKFAALAEIWDDAELTEYFVGRARKWGVRLENPMARV